MRSEDEPSDTVQVQRSELHPLQVLVNGKIEEFDDLQKQEFRGKMSS